MNETTIRCIGCGFEGKPDQAFLSKGHDPYLGRLCYGCPSCGRDLYVDPMEALGSPKVQGIPARRQPRRSPERKFLNALVGLSGIGMALFLVAGFSVQWWAYIAAGILLFMAWQCSESEQGTGSRV